LGTSREKYKEAIEIILREFTKLKNVEVPPKELSKAKEQLKGNLILSSENTSNRMTRIAKMELYFRRLFTLDEILSFIDEVTAPHVLQLARDIFQNKYLTITSIGPITQEDFNRVKLEC
jgi:predicted Zn-dependent peptidase